MTQRDGSRFLHEDAPHGFRAKIQFFLIDSRSRLGKLIDVCIILLNLMVVLLFIISTYYPQDEVPAALVAIENTAVAFFIVEYIARLYGARNRLRHLYNVYSVIDLVAILPTLIGPFVGTAHIDLLKLLRMFRVFRVLRFLRFFETEEFFFGRISNEMLKVLRLAMTVFMIFFVASGLIFLTEGGMSGPESQKVNPAINNFADAFYFTVVTLTTVGFGDIIPVSGQGKAVTVLSILTGVALIPWQIGMIIREWLHLSQKRQVECTSCGLTYHDPDAVHCKACGALIFQHYEGD